MRSIIIIGLLALTYCGRTVYMCHDDPFKDEQCLKVEKLGENTFYWLRKCKGSKVCVELPYYSYTIGACSIKVRSHYDGESCANDNKCTSGICGGTKCKGLLENQRCELGLGQCKKGLLCRYKDSSTTDYHRCLAPVDGETSCTGLTGSNTIFRAGNNFLISNNDQYFNPANNPCKLGKVCSSTGKCVDIGSVASSTTVNEANPLACKSGLSDGTNCVDTLSSGSHYTSKEGTFSNFGNATSKFEDWLKELGKDKTKDEDAIYEAYRYTRKKKKINKLFYQYTHAPFVEDADECAFDYMWKQESSNTLKLSLMIFILALLF
jgi:hypothetical protein